MEGFTETGRMLSMYAVFCCTLFSRAAIIIYRLYKPPFWYGELLWWKYPKLKPDLPRSARE